MNLVGDLKSGLQVTFVTVYIEKILKVTRRILLVWNQMHLHAGWRIENIRRVLKILSQSFCNFC